MTKECVRKCKVTFKETIAEVTKTVRIWPNYESHCFWQMQSNLEIAIFDSLYCNRSSVSLPMRTSTVINLKVIARQRPFNNEGRHKLLLCSRSCQCVQEAIQEKILMKAARIRYNDLEKAKKSLRFLSAIIMDGKLIAQSALSPIFSIIDDKKSTLVSSALGRH